jgi:hypothetical protein
VQVRPGTHPEMEHLKGPSLWRALALHANIRLGWKSLPVTNTLPYYENLQLTEKEALKHCSQVLKNVYNRHKSSKDI